MKFTTQNNGVIHHHKDFKLRLQSVSALCSIVN